MKISDLLAQAAACTDQASLDALMARLQEAFTNARELKGLRLMNPDAIMEGDKPFVYFELSRLISDQYATSLRVEIRDGALTVEVRTDHFLDGLGFGSQSWEECHDLDDGLVEVGRFTDTDEMATKASEIAIRHHAELIERVGVPPGLAHATAKSCW